MADRTLAFIDGRIYTLAEPPVVEAVFMQDGKIAATGSNEEIQGYSPDRTIDLNGLCVLPGFVDGHGHVTSFGKQLSTLDLTQTKSLSEVLEKTQEALCLKQRGEWLIGRGWNEENWQEKSARLDHRIISAFSSENPIWLVRVCGHVGLANEMAMKMAGVNNSTQNPAGGEIVRDPESGQPLGLFIDNAMKLITNHIPLPSLDTIKSSILKAQERLVEYGLTQIHDAGCDLMVLNAYRELNAEGRLNLRIYAMIFDQFLKDVSPFADGNLTCRAVKFFADGSLGSRGAWLIEPYDDMPKDSSGRPNYGICVTSPSELIEMGKLAVSKGFQVCTHAIGDRGVREVLDIYNRIGCGGKRFRVEHLQIVVPEDIARFNRLGVIASMQPCHAISDMHMAERRVGSRRLVGAYACKKMIDSGTKVCFGSDFPVESADPLWGFYTAVTRQNTEAKPFGGWLPNEKVSRIEALRAYTVGCAYASFEEEARGTIEPGKLADLTVLSRDIMEVEMHDILDTTVKMTVIGGKVVFER